MRYLKQGNISLVVETLRERGLVFRMLSRRTRSLLLDTRASVEAAPAVAQVLAAELGRDEEWVRRQVEEYTHLAAGYLPPTC